MTPTAVQVLTAFEKLRWPMMTIWESSGSEEPTPYLRRHYLSPNADWWRKKLRLHGYYLHYFFRGDKDRELHNHPWDEAQSLIVAGGYIDTRLEGGRRTETTYLPGMVNRITNDTFHRVELISEGCWTLFRAGRKSELWDPVSQKMQPKWGFLSDDGSFEYNFERERRLAALRSAAAGANEMPGLVA